MLTRKKDQVTVANSIPHARIHHQEIEQFGKSNARPNTLNFADRNGILFEWNNEVDEYPEGLVKEDVVLYPSLAAEIPGVVLERDLPIPTIKDEIKPQGCTKDATAGNANLESFYIAGVDALIIICANNNKINKINDDNDGILSIATIPVNNNHNPFILPNTSDPDTLDNKDQNKDEENKDDSIDEDSSQGDGQEVDKPEEGSTDNQDQGLRRSKRNNKGMTAKYADHGLMMNARGAKGGQSLATICGSLMFFLAEDLSNVKPIPEDDRLEWVLGIALVHYSMKAGIKKFQDQGQSRCEQGAHTDARHGSIPPGHKRFADQGGEEESCCITDVPQGEKGPLGKGKSVRRWMKTEGGLNKTRRDTPHRVDGSSLHHCGIQCIQGMQRCLFDIPGSFLHADSDKDITMILKGKLVELMVQVVPNLYRKYILQISIQLHLFTKIRDFLHARCKKSLLDVKNLPVD
jgi:hypothetical protein